MWTTFSKQSTQKILVPGEFSVGSTITVPATVGGIELVAEDLVNTVRFINLAVAPTADSNGDPISVYIGIGIIPTPTLYSFEMLSGQNVNSLQINGQQIMAICELGKTLDINIQTSLAIIKSL